MLLQDVPRELVRVENSRLYFSLWTPHWNEIGYTEQGRNQDLQTVGARHFWCTDFKQSGIYKTKNDFFRHIVLFITDTNFK